ncbi:MAG: hypothetical protein HC917_24205 [Richelia sp. SM2_1_7]|nr:hypothetical protein [Richelia sp. SM2_1_7]
MKEVLAHIEKKKQEFAKLEFFEFLEDKSIPPRQRLGFAPCFVPFVMGFGELNRYVWRDEPTNDPIQAIINQHTYEDDGHWIWFLEDLTKLGFDMSSTFTDTTRFIWSKEIQVSRQTFYEIYRRTYKAAPIHKLVAIEAIEAIADIFLSTTTLVAKELELTSGIEYKYFGMHHYSIDSNHSMDSVESVESISNIELEKDVEKEALELVNEMFDLFAIFVDVLVKYAKRYELESLSI